MKDRARLRSLNETPGRWSVCKMMVMTMTIKLMVMMVMIIRMMTPLPMRD